jgi:hypothetical protein
VASVFLTASITPHVLISPSNENGKYFLVGIALIMLPKNLTPRRAEVGMDSIEWKLLLPRPTETDKKYMAVVQELLKISYQDNIVFFKALGLYPPSMSEWAKSGFVPRDRWRQFEFMRIVDGRAHLVSDGEMTAGIPAKAGKDVTTGNKTEACQEKMILKNPSTLALEARIKQTNLLTVSHELGVSRKAISGWIKRGIVPEKYSNDKGLVGKEAIP